MRLARGRRAARPRTRAAYDGGLRARTAAAFSALALCLACAEAPQPAPGPPESPRAAIPAAPPLGAAHFSPAARAHPAGRLRLPRALIEPAAETWAKDLDWLTEVARVPLGRPLSPEVSRAADRAPEMWRDLGFTPGADGLWARRVDLLDPLPALVPTQLESLPGIDCIATTSVDRHLAGEPYLHQTLRSTFAAFPDGIQINVLVNTMDLDYLTPARLARAIGKERVAQVHVHAVAPEVARYLADELPPHRRGGWNYARALRAYTGTRGLVLMEDDVAWAAGGPPRLAAWQKTHALPAVSLFNHLCARLSGELDFRRANLRVDEVDARRHHFINLQAMLYHPDIAAGLGRYLHLRQHKEVYDHVVGWFFTHNGVRLGYGFPSLTQHIGRASAAQGPGFTWAFHDSPCFRARYDDQPDSLAPAAGGS